MPLFSKLYSKTIIAVSIAVLGSLPAQAASELFCTAYANKALGQFETGKEANCKDLNYPVWSTDFKHHYDWCRTVSEDDANKGAEQRVDVLEACGVTSSPASGIITGVAVMADLTLEPTCSTYAQSGVDQQQQNLDMSCGLVGPEWNPKFDDHYNWCMHGENVAHAEGEKSRRQDAVDKCAAASGTPNSVSPILIPGPQTKSISPIPRTALDPGLGDKTPNNVDMQNVAIDPGIGGQVPSIIIIQNLAQRATSAPSRGDLIDALMADPATRSQLQALPNISRNPQNLAQQTLGGSSVSSSVSVAGNPTQTGNMSGNMSASSGQKLPKGVSWTAGIQFSPYAEPPTYYIGGKASPLGSTQVIGAIVSNQTVGSMNQKKVVFLGNQADMILTVDLPNETATYIVAFGLSMDNYTSHPSHYQGSSPPLQAMAMNFPMNNFTPLTLTPLSGGKGFVAMVQIQRDMSLAPSEVSTRQFILTVDGLGAGFFFGGITLTKM